MDTPPLNLYKYYSASAGLSVLKSKKVRFTPPIRFNDPFDQNPSHNLSDAVLLRESRKRAARDMGYANPVLIPKEAQIQFVIQMNDRLAEARTNRDSNRKSIASKYHEQFSDTFGVFCLTENQSDLIMWAHYAEEHKGFLFEFSIDAHIDILRPVKYEEERPIMDTDPSTSLYRKGSDWKNEREWRMYLPLKALQKKESKDAPIHLWQLDGISISAVYLGCRFDQKMVNDVCEAARKLPLPTGRLFKMDADSDRFQLNPTPISF